MIDPRTPCLIGSARHTWPPGSSRAPEPLEMWQQVVRAAAGDAAATNGGVLGAVDSLDVIYTQSWQYDDPCGRLAARLGMSPRRAEYSGIGGTTPQHLVDGTAGRMLSGELDLAVIVGAEALHTRRVMKKAGEKPAWSFPDAQRKPFPLEAPFLDTEIAHEVFQAWLTFAMWDVGRRARLAADPVEYRAACGALLAPMSAVAARNPLAWYPIERSVQEVITPTSENRMVGYPYTKYMISVMDVDMAAALVIATHAKADELGVPADRRVYLRGWCYATDPYYLAEHNAFDHSPAMAAASTEALRVAGLTIDDVAHLDLYSCFSSSVNFARDALGLAGGDERPLTVTGGLPYHGGPGSNYLAHSIGETADVLRRDPGTFGLVSGVGMHMTKHVFGVYSTQPPSRPIDPPDEAGVQARLDANGKKPIRDIAAGDASIATYSVVHGRSGEPAWALAVCDLPGGDRCYARVLDAGLLRELEAHEWVGRSVHLIDGGDNVNLVTA
ncbi:MAG: acetyl-CoA synthetase [Actinobacteria bacterium]|nr:acetyl-CoA synthetase [Actinomycetota bacterium]